MIKRYFSGFFQSLGQHRKAIAFLFQSGLAWYFIFPVLINLVLFISGFSLVGMASEYTLEWLNSWLQDLEWGMEESGWVYQVFYVFVWITFRLFYFLLFAYLGGYLVLMLLSPVLSLLSEQVANRRGKESLPFQWNRFLNDIFRGLAIAGRNLLLEILFLILFFALSFVPVIGVVSPFALFFLTAYYYGFSVMDYNMERRQMGMDASIRYMRRNRGSVLGIGIPFAVVLLIPVLGAFLCGFVAIVATTAGVLEVHRLEELE